MNCGKKIIDPEIRNLVYAFNTIGISVWNGCQGHNDFDNGFYYGFPWIWFDGHENIDRIEVIIDEYNQKKEANYSNWIVEFRKDIMGYWTYPEEINRRLEDLIKESKVLAKFVLSKRRF